MKNGCGKTFFYLILCGLDEDNFNDLGALISYKTLSLLHNSRAYMKYIYIYVNINEVNTGRVTDVI